MCMLSLKCFCIAVTSESYYICCPVMRIVMNMKETMELESSVAMPILHSVATL